MPKYQVTFTRPEQTQKGFSAVQEAAIIPGQGALSTEPALTCCADPVKPTSLGPGGLFSIHW